MVKRFSPVKRTQNRAPHCVAREGERRNPFIYWLPQEIREKFCYKEEQQENEI